MARSLSDMLYVMGPPSGRKRSLFTMLYDDDSEDYSPNSSSTISKEGKGCSSISEEEEEGKEEEGKEEEGKEESKPEPGSIGETVAKRIAERIEYYKALIKARQEQEAEGKGKDNISEEGKGKQEGKGNVDKLKHQ